MQLPSPIPHPLQLLHVPQEAWWILEFAVGADWPDGDERATWDLADEWYAAAHVLAERAHLPAAAAAEVVASWGGLGSPVPDAFAATWSQLIVDGQDFFAVLVAECNLYGELVEATGCDIEGAKIEIWIETIILAIEILACIAAAVITFGASLAGTAPAMFGARMIISQIFRRLVSQIATRTVRSSIRAVPKLLGRRGLTALATRSARHAAEEGAEELGTSLYVQSHQIELGRRDGYDSAALFQSAVGGAVGGALGGLAGLGGHASSRLGRFAEHVGRGAAGEVLAETGAGLATGQGLPDLGELARSVTSGGLSGSLDAGRTAANQARANLAHEGVAELASTDRPDLAALAGRTPTTTDHPISDNPSSIRDYPAADKPTSSIAPPGSPALRDAAPGDLTLGEPALGHASHYDPVSYDAGRSPSGTSIAPAAPVTDGPSTYASPVLAGFDATGIDAAGTVTPPTAVTPDALSPGTPLSSSFGAAASLGDAASLSAVTPGAVPTDALMAGPVSSTIEGGAVNSGGAITSTGDPDAAVAYRTSSDVPTLDGRTALAPQPQELAPPAAPATAAIAPADSVAAGHVATGRADAAQLAPPAGQALPTPVHLGRIRPGHHSHDLFSRSGTRTNRDVFENGGEVPQTEEAVVQIANLLGIDLSGVRVVVITDPEYIRYLDAAGAVAVTPFELGGAEIHFGPASFADIETLVATIAHEFTHVEQLRAGDEVDSANLRTLEDAAYGSEGPALEKFREAVRSGQYDIKGELLGGAGVRHPAAGRPAGAGQGPRGRDLKRYGLARRSDRGTDDGAGDRADPSTRVGARAHDAAPGEDATDPRGAGTGVDQRELIRPVDPAAALVQAELARTADGSVDLEQAQRLLESLPDLGDGELSDVLRDLAARTLGTDVSVTRVGGEGNKGGSGAPVFVVRDATGTPVAIAKMFPDPTEFVAELSAVRRLQEAGLADVGFSDVLAVATMRSATEPARGVLIVTLAPGQAINDQFPAIRDASPERRAEAVAALEESVTRLGAALARLHTAPDASGGPVASAYLDRYIAITEGHLREVLAHRSYFDSLGFDVDQLAQRLRGLIDMVRADPGPASLVHGDADPGNFFDDPEHGITLIDLSTLHCSIGAHGEGIGTPARDVANFHRLLSHYGRTFNLTEAEVARLEAAFLAAYRDASGAEIPAHAMEFFAAHSAMYQLVELPSRQPSLEVPASELASQARSTIAHLRRHLGLPAPDPVKLRPPAPAEEAARHRRLAEELSALWAAGASPREIIDHLLAAEPELASRYAEISVPKERYRLYEHTQMVLGQYARLVAGESDAGRLMPIDTVVKTILLHDLDKRAARDRFGHDRGEHDALPEHLLTVEALWKYRGLFADDTQLRAAAALVDSDPFGFYLRGFHDADTAFSYLAATALRLSGRPIDAELSREDAATIAEFFREAHQYYQADVSSYTSHSRYTPPGSEQTVAGLPSLDRLFATDDDGQLLRTPEGWFAYSDANGYRERFAALAEMFATPDRIIQEHRRIFSPDHTAWRRAHGVNLVERALSAEVGEATVTDDYRVTSSREARLEAVRLLADRISASTEDLMAVVVTTSAGSPRASSDMLTRLGDPAYGLELFDPRYPALGGYVVPLAGIPAADVGTRVIPMDEPGMPRLVREIAVAELVRAWAVSANGTTRSLAIQEVAGQHFASGPVRDWPIPDEWRPTIERAVREHGAVLREFLQAQYELTQQRLAERGITELVLYRGFQWPGADRPEWASAAAGSVVPLPRPRPLSAWTSSLSVAIDWTLGAAETATVISTRVPAEAVLSIELTGFGCLWQHEFVVVARPMYARLEAVRDASTLDVAHGWPIDPHLDPSALEQAGHIMRGLPPDDRVQLLTAVGTARPVTGALVVELRALVADMPGVEISGAPEVRSLASLAEAYDVERRATGATVDDFLASQTDLIRIPLTVPSSQRAVLLNRLAAQGYSVTDSGDRLSVIAPIGIRFELSLSEVDS